MLAAVLTQLPAALRADVLATPSTESGAGPAMDSWLVARGLIARARYGEASETRLIIPPAGVEVDETSQSVNGTNQELMRVKSWDEVVGENTVHLEVSTLPENQYEVGFWLFPNHQSGCTTFQWTLYSKGRALQSRFWRSDARPRLAGSPDLPTYLYPDAVPWMAFLRVLEIPNEPREGADGTMNQQITPYNYVGQNVTVGRVENVSVPAGSFSAYKVTAQVDVATMMPHWPRFMLNAIKPAVPKDTLYFQSKAPYRLLKQEGPIFMGGPEVTTQLIRFYTAENPAVATIAPAAPSSIAKP